MATYTPAIQDALDEYSHLDLTLNVVSDAPDQIGGGGFSDVFRSKMCPGWQARHDPHVQQLLSETQSIAVASLESDHNCVVIAVKRLRFWGRPIPKVEKAIVKELKIWTGLSHPNVLPILGYVQRWSGSIYPSFVSPWMENGTLRDYLKRDDSNVDILQVPMARGIASGLQYLHSQQVIHADLKCDNVLLSPALRPLLTDFGVSRQIIASVSTTTAGSSGTLRWKAPELLNEAGKENEKTDVWAFGMTLLEILTKDIPYGGISDVQVVRGLVDGILPTPSIDLIRRSSLYKHLWTLCQCCWIRNSSMRPTALEVQSRLNWLIQQYPLNYPYSGTQDIGQSGGIAYRGPSQDVAAPSYQETLPASTTQYIDGKLILFYGKALYDYQATNDEEFDFRTGDVIAVTSTPEDGWWTGVLLDHSRRAPAEGTVFPSNFVSLNLFTVKALYDYQATADEEFDFQTGDLITVTSTTENGWWTGVLLDDSRRVPGRTVFPSNFVCLY